MAVTIALDQDEALVLFDLLSSRALKTSLQAPERNALNALEALLEKQLTAPLLSNYSELVHAARRSLLDRYGP